MKNRFSAESGMTLLELLFASGILALSLSLAFGSLVSVNRVGGVVEDRTIATTHILTVFEQLTPLNYQTLLLYQPPTFTGLTRRSTTGQVVSGTVAETVVVDVYTSDGSTLRLPQTTAPSVALPNPMRIRVTVTWMDKQGRLQSYYMARWFYF